MGADGFTVTREGEISIPLVLVLLVVLVQSIAMVTAMRTTSTTFDEIVMIAGGARGYDTGDWTLAPEHPPFTQYMYGLLPHISGVNYPDETGVDPASRQGMGFRYRYAQTFFWGSGNNPEAVAFLGRLPSLFCALALTFVVFGFIRKHYGDQAGLLGASLIAFMPDVLAHGGVAYNDMPITLAYVLALLLIDRAIRSAEPKHAIIAGLAIGVSLGIKNSAVGLAPAAVLLLILEAVSRKFDGVWLKRIALATTITFASAYVALVLVYRGDFALTEYRYALDFVARQVTATRAPSYLLGEISTQGFPLYFPIAFLYKTSAGLHVLMAIAIVAFLSRLRSLRAVLDSPLRAPAIGALVFGAMLLTSQLNIGFRYGMPLLPLIAIITAIGAWKACEAWGRIRHVVTVAAVWMMAHSLSYYPHFLAYVSEYGPGRDRNYEILADSSLDWGQGLLLLRDYMREHSIPSVYLSYFGSAWPAGYGIEYVPLVSFFPLPPRPAPAQLPEYVAISATNLSGTYFGNVDAFARFKQQQPVAVLGHTIFLYRVVPEAT